MARRLFGVTGIALWIVLIVVLCIPQSCAIANPLFKKLPQGWTAKPLVVSPDNISAISTKLGGRITKLTNTMLSFQNNQVQINAISCPTTADAEKIYIAVLKGHNGERDYVSRVGNTVIEFAKSNDVNFVNQASGVLYFASLPLDLFTAKYIKKIPADWHLNDSFPAPTGQAAAIGKKLNGNVRNISNTLFVVNDKKFQVNIIDCPTPQDANKIHQAILAAKSDPAFCILIDSAVIEFVSDDVKVAKEAVYELGIKPNPDQAADKQASKEDPLETQARDFVTLLAEQRFEKAVTYFDDTMKTALPAEKLKEAWNALPAQFGPFEKQLDSRKEKIAEYDVVYVTCKFQKDFCDVKVVYNNQKQITGLFFVPAKEQSK